MATMYTSGFASDETVNLRATPNGTVLVRIRYGEAVEATPSSTDGWHHATYSTYTGYMRSKFLSYEDPNASSSTSGSWGMGTVYNGKLYCRKSPSKDAAYWGRFSDGARIPIKVYDSTWYETYWDGNQNQVGYVMRDYVTNTSFGGASEGTTTTETYYFEASDAVAYALHHSDDSGMMVCAKRNTSFSCNGESDCANFVHQCLCAGGVPMFNGWSYHLTGIPSSWTTTAWKTTNSGRKQLLDKGWINKIAYNQIQPGDIIYTYKKDATPTPYTHVTIAVSTNYSINVGTNKEKFGCDVCGYTWNQNSEFKELTASNCECYRVKSTLIGDGTEKRVFLPLIGNGAEVL